MRLRVPSVRPTWHRASWGLQWVFANFPLLALTVVP